MIFPKIWSYPFDRKWKMIFFKKYMEKSYIVQIFWKDGLFKKMHWNMIFLVLSGKIGFFLAKRWSSFFGRKLKDDLSEEIHENMILSLCTYRCHKHDIVPLSQKKSKIIFSCKNAPKGDWHPIDTNNSLYFYRDPYRRFHILLSSEEDPGNLIYRIEVWLLLQFIRLEILYYEESLILCTIQPSDVVFGGVLGCQPRKLSDH